MKIPELLAPVGSMEHLKIAINAGASSIYLSGKNYGARKFAKNFTINEINEAVNICHMHNVKVYVTVNTLIKEDELESVINYLSKLHAIGVDAVLVQDLGIIELINKHIPKLKIHASTQMTIENQLKLNYIENKGIKRVVLPREMKKEEIKKLNTNIELEMFVHGALCYSYSGQCLMSSFKGGRSGNRGSCAQPCRQKYKISNIKKEDYYLSPVDLCLYDKLKEIIELNIDCIKIEGRMRSKEYLAITISSYRKALNKLKSNKENKNEEINLVFNRGFSEGKFSNKSKKSLRSGHIGLEIGKVYEINKNQIAIKLKDNITTIPEKGDGILFIKDDKDYGMEISQTTFITTLNHFKKGKNKQIKDFTRKNKILIIKKVKQNKKNTFNLADSKVFLTKHNKIIKKAKEIENKGSSYIKSKLTLTFSIKNKYPQLKAKLILANKKEILADITGNTPFEKPLKKNISSQNIKKQLSKVGNYPFEITQININYDGTLFIPISKINKLRRDLFTKLEQNLIKEYKNKNKTIQLKQMKNNIHENEINLSYYTNNLKDLEKINNVKKVYLEIPPENDSIVKQDCEEYNLNYMINFLKEAIKISQQKTYTLIWKWPDICHDKLIKVLNQTNGILRKMHMNIPIMSGNFNSEYGSYSMNMTNSESVNSLKNYKIITISPELRKKDYESLIMNCENPEKIEILAQGKIELMKTRYDLLYEKENKKANKKSYLMDNKNKKYPIHKSISQEELIILNDSEISLLEEIPHLIDMGYCNFSIDGRWQDEKYLKMIDIYNSAIDGKIMKKELLKISPKNTLGNY